MIRLFNVIGNAEYYFDFLDMFQNYNKELHDIDNRVEECDICDVYMLFHQGDTEIFFLEKDAEILGFIIVGTGANKHKASEYYIQETYIKPEYRHKGYGRTMCDEVIKMYPNMVNMYILRKNTYAQKFWSNVYKDYEDVSAEYGHDDELCYEKFFKNTKRS